MANQLPAPPAGVSKSNMWSRLVRSERKSKALGKRTGNPINPTEFVMDSLAAGAIGLLQAKVPQLDQVAGRIDGRLAIAGGSVLAYMALKKPPKVIGSLARGSFYPWMYDQGRALAGRV